MLRSTDIAHQHFSTVTLREGYDINQVDEYLGLIRAALEARERGFSTALAATDVVNIRFATTRFRQGYNQDEVDNFLDAVVATLREHGSV